MNFYSSLISVNATGSLARLFFQKRTSFLARMARWSMLAMLMVFAGYAQANTTSGNSGTGSALYSGATYGCTSCHTNPTSPYPSQLNAANSGSLVDYYTNTLAMGNQGTSGSDGANIAAFIATFATIDTTAAVTYNTAKTGINTSIYIGGTQDGFNNDISGVSATSGGSPAKGALSFVFTPAATPALSTITYTPTSGACGTDSFSYQGTGASANISTSVRTVSVTISNPPVPSITSSGAGSGTVNVNGTQYTTTASSTQSTSLCGVTNFSATSVAYSSTATGYTTTSSGWPAGVSLNTTTGAISGTPTTGGTFNVTVFALNPGGASTGKAVTLTINPGAQSITVPSAPTITFSSTNTSTGSVATTASSGLTVQYAAAGGCTVDAAGAVTGTAAGTNNCTITFTQGGDSNFSAATPQTLTFNINKANQNVVVPAAPVMVFNGAAGSVATTAPSGTSVTYSSTTTGVCTVNASGQVTAVTAGSCTIVFNELVGSSNFNPAPTDAASLTFNIAKASQTITFTQVPSVTVGGTGTVIATGGGSGLQVLFSTTSASSICTVSSAGLVTGVGLGTCVVKADQAGDTNYSAGTQTQNIAIGLTAQTITPGAAPTGVTVGTTGTVSATASSGLAVTFTSVNTPSVCSVSGAVVTGLTAGTCDITASQAGDGVTFAAATPQSITFNVAKGSQTLSFGSAPSGVIVRGTGTLTASSLAANASPTGLTPTLSSQTNGVCTVSGNTVTGVAVGNCIVAADQPGSANYLLAGTVTQNFAIGKGNQTISSLTVPTVGVGGTGTISATVPSGLPIAFSSLTTSTCTVSGNTITGVAVGACTVAANQAGDVNNNAAPQVTQGITVGIGNQAISFAGVPNTLAFGTPLTLAATGGNSGNPIIYNSTTTSVCTVAGAVLTTVNIGTCNLTADQAGNSNYNAAPQQTYSITIGVAPQVISFGAAPSITLGGSGNVTATGGASGNPVTFTSLTSSVCSVTGSTVHGLALGTCTVAANQLGNGTTYAAAVQATLDIAISTVPQPNAAALTVPLNTATTLDLAPFIVGSTISGVSLVNSPKHGTVLVSGTRITYTPTTDYFGTDTFTYYASVQGQRSPDGVVNVTVVGRPDPTQNTSMLGMVSAQMDTVKRFTKAQLFNFQQRLESLHHGGRRGGGRGVATTNGNALAQMMGVPVNGGQNLDQANAVTTTSNTAFGRAPAAGAVNSASENGGVANAAPVMLAYQGGSPERGQVSDANNDLVGLLNSPIANTFVSALKSASFNLAALSSATGMGLGDSDNSGELDFWISGNLRFGSRNKVGEVGYNNFTTDGVTIGADKRISEQMVLGMGVGYAHDKTIIGEDGTKTVSDGTSVAVYGSYQPMQNTYLDALIGYGVTNFNSDRYVSSVSDFAKLTRKGDQIFASVTGGYEFRENGYMLSPYGRVDLAYDRLRGGTETGVGQNALHFNAQNSRSAQVSLGVRAEATHQMDFGIAYPHARLEFQHSMSNDGDANIQYADLLSTNYRISAINSDRNAVVFGLGSDFILNHGMKITFDYQTLRSTDHESSQGISFRLTKEFDAPNNQIPYVLPENLSLPNLGIRLDMGYTIDDNITRSRIQGERFVDRLFSVNLTKGKNIPLAEHTRIVLSGNLGAEKSYTYRGLDHVTLGGQAEFQYRPSGDFTAPVYGVFAKLATDQYNSKLRDGYRMSGGVDIRKPVTDRINLFGALAYNVRKSSSKVFDTKDVSVRGNVDYMVTPESTLYFTGEFRHGDIVSTGSSSDGLNTLASLDGSTAHEVDDVFVKQGFIDYRFTGNTVLTTIGYNLPIGPTDGLDFSWRRAESTPNTVPFYVSHKSSYVDNQYSIVYLVRF